MYYNKKSWIGKMMNRMVIEQRLPSLLKKSYRNFPYKKGVDNEHSPYSYIHIASIIPESNQFALKHQLTNFNSFPSLVKKLSNLSGSTLFVLSALLFFTGCNNSSDADSKASDVSGIQHDTESGFVTIFDGKSLDGWEGAEGHWRVEDGQIVGSVTEEKPLKANTFLIWRDGEPVDFELKLDFKITETGNSGVQYRSEELQDPPLAMKGYQADIDGKNTYTGQNYEERGRGFLAKRGEISILENGKEPKISGSLGDPDELKKKINKEDWNELHLVIKGNHMKHYVNGVLMSEVTDNDKKLRKMKGKLGIQIHTGPPMEVRCRNIKYKDLSKK